MSFYGMDGRPYRLWHLGGATVEFLSSEAFAADVSAIGLRPVDPDDGAQWRSLRWLPQFYGPSAANGLSDRTTWSIHARVAIKRGALVAKMPIDHDDRHSVSMEMLAEEGGKMTSKDGPRARALVTAVEFASSVTIVLRTPTGTRTILLPKDEEAVISNTASIGGGHEDSAVLGLLEAPLVTTRELKKSGVLIAPSQLDICDNPCIIVE